MIELQVRRGYKDNPGIILIIFPLVLNIFYFQSCTLRHINNTMTKRKRIGAKAYSLYKSSPEHVYIVSYQAEGKTVCAK